MNIVVDGYNICYKTTGTGDKTVVILQGWGTDLGASADIFQAGIDEI